MTGTGMEPNASFLISLPFDAFFTTFFAGGTPGAPPVGVATRTDVTTTGTVRTRADFSIGSGRGGTRTAGNRG